MQVLITAIWWLAVCEALEVQRQVNSSIVNDNESAESAPRLYARAGNIVRVYASSSPYGAYSYKVPTVINGPLAAGSQVAPISVSDSLSKGSSGYLRSLRDSYGKFLATPQAVAYKAAFPQQFLPIQALPAHLSQPLAAGTTPNLQYRPFTPNYFFGTPYKVPSLYSYSATPTPLTQLGFTKPLVYAGNIKNLSPVSSFLPRGNQLPGFVPTQQQQATGSKNLYANAPDVEQKPQQHNVLSAHGSTQTLGENNGKGQIQAAPAQTSVTAFVNGKKTVVTLDTNPPVPQIDISLLEPLTFENPVVPQVQHFLPKLNSATYTKLPVYNIQHSNKIHKDIPVHRINVYNSEDLETKPKKTSDKKKTRQQNIPAKPQVVVNNDNPNEQEFSYEIDMPNHKETYNEQVVSYEKETNMKPVTYAYNKQSQSEPENYSYSHSSKEPSKVTHVEYGDNESPKHLVYTFSPEENEEENNAEHQHRSESEETTDSNGDENPVSQRESSRYDEEENKHIEDNIKYTMRHKNYKNDDASPKEFIRNESPVGHSHDSNYQDLPEHYSTQQTPGHVYYSSNQRSPSPQHHKNRHVHHSHPPAHYRHHHHSTERTSNPIQNTELPRQSTSLKAEHRGQEYKQQPKQELQHEVTHNIKSAPHYYSQPLTVAVQNAVQLITPEYEEDIKILPAHAPNAPQRIQSHPTRLPNPKPFSSAAPHVLEQSNRVIIKEKEETPDVNHPQMEQGAGETDEGEESEEEDFEKAYKASAFGFPAYEAVTEEMEDGESDVDDPDSYGAPRYGTDNYNVNTPFEKYQVEDDPYPKSLHSSYKDASENKKEDYYLDFAVNKPNVYADFYKKKADYYKLFKQHKPEKPFFQNRDENNREMIENEDERKVEAASSYLYPVLPAQPKQIIYNSQYKTPKTIFKYDYGKPRDNRAYASQPYIHKHKTNFVEPQFQYGFEPITAPLVLDSELAAMASNDSPESEKPGMRKKVYEENWYIKKTRTAAGKPS